MSVFDPALQQQLDETIEGLIGLFELTPADRYLWIHEQKLSPELEFVLNCFSTAIDFLRERPNAVCPVCGAQR